MRLCWGYIKFHGDNGKENGSYYLGSTVSGYLSEGPDNDAPGPCSRAHTCVHMKDLQALPVNSTLQRRGNRSKKSRIFSCRQRASHCPGPRLRIARMLWSPYAGHGTRTLLWFGHGCW